MLAKSIIAATALTLSAFAGVVFAAEPSTSAITAHALITASPDAKVFIISPANGATVPTTFTVKFGISGIELSPAGIAKANSGHHHLLIDTDPLPDLTKALPATDKIIHFGQAQTETEITLAPGTHTLQLVLGNYLHVPHTTPVISEKITVTVAAPQ